MSLKFFRFPYASGGDKTAISDVLDPSGVESYQEGRGPDYARDPDTDPLVKLIDRSMDNQFKYDVTENLRQWQTNNYPEFITSAQNGGTAFAYDFGVVVRYDDGGGFKLYKNFVDGNTNAPDVSGWQLFEESITLSTLSISTLIAIDTSTLTDGTKVNAGSYHLAINGGGGVFYWDSTKDKALHNGGTIIDPDITFPTDWTNQTQLAAWFTAGTGAGCWVRETSTTFNIKDFGAKLDGVTLDYLPIQQTHDTSAATGSILGFKDVNFGTGIVNMGDNTLTWSSNISAISDGSVILQFANTSAKGIHISTEFGNWDTPTKQLRYNLKEVFSGNFVIENTLGFGSNTAIGMFFGDDGVDAFSAESIQLTGVKIRGWSKSHTFGSHAYIISFHHCRFDDNGTAIFIATGNGVDTYFDSWEKISYKECIFAGNINVIDGDSGSQGDYSFDNCSIDYNNRVLASFDNTAIIQFLNGCHIEWNSETDVALSVLGVVSVKDCYILWLNATGTPPAILLAGVGSNGVMTLRDNTYTLPSGAALVQLSTATSVLYGELNPLYYQGGAPTYVTNPGAGTTYLV